MTITEMIELFDSGEIVPTIEMGGLGPGYEQAIQLAAIEMARAGKDTQRLDDDEAEEARWSSLCNIALKSVDANLGLSGAQFDAARWLAWQWCYGKGGPDGLKERARQQGHEDRIIQISNDWPHVETRGIGVEK